MSSAVSETAGESGTVSPAVVRLSSAVGVNWTVPCAVGETDSSAIDESETVSSAVGETVSSAVGETVSSAVGASKTE